MSFTATAIQEVPEVQIGTLLRSTFPQEMSEADAPEPVNANISATIAGDSVEFKLQEPVDGVHAAGPVIAVTKRNIDVNLVITLEGNFSFQSPAILWINPPQQGYSTNPFGTSPILPQFNDKTAIIPNSTMGLTSRLTTPFALFLKDDRNNHTVVIDPTIIDDPNT